MTLGAASVPAGTTVPVAARASFVDGTSRDVTADSTWTASNPANVEILPREGFGKARGVGTSVITAVWSGVAASASLEVTQPIVLWMDVSPTDVTVPKGRTTQLQVDALLSDGVHARLATWVTSNAAVATVDQDGVVTARGVGEARISATLGGAVVTAAVTVTAPVVESIAVTPTTVELAAGRSQIFAVTATLSDGTTPVVTGSATWQSSDTTVGTISGGTLATLRAGSITVTATYQGKSATAVVTVTAPVVDALAVAPATVSLAAGRTVNLVATATLSDGSTPVVTGSATWQSSDTTVGTISGATLTTVKAGSTIVTARYGGKSATASVTVTGPVVDALAVTPATVSLAAGRSQVFVAAATLSDGTTPVVTADTSWQSSDPSVGNMSGATLTTLRAGSVTVTATYQGKSATAAVTVTAPVLDAVTVTPAVVSLPLGVGEEFAATAIYSDQHTADVTVAAEWTSSDPGVGTLSGAALSTLAAGTTTVSATYQGKTGAAAVTVTAPVVARIVISTDPVFVRLPTQFRATAIYTDANHTADVTAAAEWTSLDTAYATVSAGGLVTGVMAGPVTINASFGGKTGSADIVVDGSPLIQVELWPVNASGPVGIDRQLTATARFADGMTKDATAIATWSSSDPSIADLVSGRPGLLRPAKAGGPITVTAKVLEVSGTTQFTVTGATLVSMQVRGDLSRIALGTRTTFHASGTFSDGSTIDPLPGVAWSSDDETVATIDGAGVALGVAAGNVWITGSLTSCPLTAATCEAAAPLTVTSAVIQSIAIAPATVAIPVGVRQPLTLTASISDGTTQDLTPYASWASSDPSIAKLDAAKPWVVVGVSPGGTVVLAKYGTSYGDFSATANVTVNGAQVERVVVTAPGTTLVQGRSMSLAATGYFDDESHFDVTDAATWTSNAPGIAAVSSGAGSHGMVTGVYAGNATISAAFRDESGSVGLTVRPFITAIAVTPDDPSIPLGRTQQFAATATYSDGHLEDLTAAVTWASSNTGVADITAVGLLATSLQGITTVTATDPEFHVVGQTQVTVSDPVIESLAVVPSYVSLAAGQSRQFTAFGTYSNGAAPVDVTALVDWSASAGTISNGLLATSTAGTITLTATAPITGATATAQALVTAAILDGIALNPAVSNLALGQSILLTLSGTMTDGTAATSITGAVWTSSAPASATVDQAGYVQSKAQGTATITVSVSGVEDAHATVNVGPKALRSIEIAEQDPTVALGNTLTLHAEGTYTDGSTETLTSGVTWSSANQSVFLVGASTGVVTTVAQGSGLVTATVGTLTGSTIVTVLPPVLQSIAVSPATVSLALGTTQQFTVTGTCSDGKPCAVTAPVSWSVTANGVASISASGLLQTLLQGPATVTATVAGVQPATATVAVTAPAVTAIRVNGDTVYVNLPTPFTAIAVYTDSTEVDVSRTATWSTVDTTYATVAPGGVVTGVAPGGATISAAYGGKTGSAQAEVRGATLDSLEIAPADATGPVGYDQQFSATVLFTDAETGDLGTRDVTTLSAWSSSMKAVADFVDATRPGLLHPYKAGGTTLTATYRTVSASTSFTVVNAKLDSIDVVSDSYRIALGTKTAFTAWGSFSDKQGNIYYVQLTDVTWSSSAPAVASIDAAGVALGVSPGVTTIQATLNSCPLSAATCTGQAQLEVTAATIQSLTVASPAPFPAGISVQLSAIGHMSDGTTQDLTAFSSWHSASNAVATVDQAGLVTGVAPGTTTVTATYAWSIPLGAGSVSGTATVTVNDAILEAIVVTSASPKNLIPEGYKVQLFAAAVYSDQSSYDVTNVATWTSSNGGIVSVSNATGTRGLATGVNFGDATVTASYRGLKGTLALKVVDGQLTDVIITSAPASDTELPSLTLDATARSQLYASGVFTTTSYGTLYIDMTDQCSWWAQPKTVAQVANVISKYGHKGLVTGIASGDAKVTVHRGVFRDDLAVHVN